MRAERGKWCRLSRSGESQDDNDSQNIFFEYFILCVCESDRNAKSKFPLQMADMFLQIILQ